MKASVWLFSVAVVQQRQPATLVGSVSCTYS